VKRGLSSERDGEAKETHTPFSAFNFRKKLANRWIISQGKREEGRGKRRYSNILCSTAEERRAVSLCYTFAAQVRSCFSPRLRNGGRWFLLRSTVEERGVGLCSFESTVEDKKGMLGFRDGREPVAACSTWMPSPR